MKDSERMFYKLRNIGWSFNDEDKDDFLKAEHHIMENIWKKKYINDKYQLNHNEWELMGFMADLLRVLLEEEA